MKKELKYFKIEGSYGGNQEWFSEFSMRLGGCGAETAVEFCIYSDKYFGTDLYPFDVNSLSKEDYARFGSLMKPFLHPRLHGIDSLDIYVKGFSKFLSERKSKVKLKSVDGNESACDAGQAIKNQIDKELPLAFLCLNHSDRNFKDYEWHWFIINGYDEREEGFFIKAVTYGNYEWLDFDKLWNSKKARKGGMVLPQITNT